jgi:hypothetical protein
VSLVLSIFSQDILPIFVIAGVGLLLARRFDASVKTLPAADEPGAGHSRSVRRPRTQLFHCL